MHSAYPRRSKGTKDRDTASYAAYYLMRNGTLADGLYEDDMCDPDGQMLQENFIGIDDVTGEHIDPKLILDAMACEIDDDYGTSSRSSKSFCQRKKLQSRYWKTASISSRTKSPFLLLIHKTGLSSKAKGAFFLNRYKTNINVVFAISGRMN